jgi:hypothetical protein
MLLPKFSLFDYFFKSGPVPYPTDLVTGWKYDSTL